MRFLLLLIALLNSTKAVALGPQHVLVLARADSPDSLRIANAYLEARGVPRNRLVLLPYTGSPHHCAFSAFERDILKPTRQAIKERGLEGRIHVWATTLGIPWRIDGNGLSGVVHFGKVVEPTKAPLLGPASFTEINRYAGVWLSIDAYHAAPNVERRPLHMHIAAGSVAQALAMIERSKSADGSFPTGAFYLCDGAGPRDVRKGSIPQATRFLDALGANVERVAGSTFTGKKDVVGLFTGDVSFPINENTFLPGAIADHLTSTGGVLDGTGGQMMCTAFLDAGCSASYGTVVEPYNYPMKFPAAMVHAAYRAGFTTVESYWMSVLWPQQGVFVGDPLARPFGKPPLLAIEAPGIGQTVRNEFQLQLRSAAAANGGVGGVEVFIDDARVAAIGQQRLPTEASIAALIGEKNYEVRAQAPSVLHALLDDLGKQLAADGYEASAMAASLMIQRKAGGATPAIKLTCTSPVLHGEVVGGKFVSAGDKEFAWLRFCTGPASVGAKTRVSTEKLCDGLHHLSIAPIVGDETTAAIYRTVPVVKRTKDARLRLKLLRPNVSLIGVNGRIVVAEATFLGDGMKPPVEFRVDERVVESHWKPPFTLTVDPSKLGVGRHTIRARTTAPRQEADEELEFHIDP